MSTEKSGELRSVEKAPRSQTPTLEIKLDCQMLEHESDLMCSNNLHKSMNTHWSWRKCALTCVTKWILILQIRFSDLWHVCDGRFIYVRTLSVLFMLSPTFCIHSLTLIHALPIWVENLSRKFYIFPSTEHLTTAANAGDSARTSLASSRESSTSAQGSQIPYRWASCCTLRAFFLYSLLSLSTNDEAFRNQ